METVSFVHMASSAALAAMTAEILTLPIDTAKVRMQVSGASSATAIATSQSRGFIPVLISMAKNEGLSAWWKGLAAGLHRQFVYATLRISMYPHIRDFYQHQKSLQIFPDMGIKVLAGMTSGAIGMTVANPTDVVKVRLQSAITVGRLSESSSDPRNRIYTGALNAYRTIVQEEGILGLWRGLGPNVVRNAIVCASEMVAYDELKSAWVSFLPDGFLCHCSAGFGAGFIATVIGSPIDVLKTRYMNARPSQYSGVGHAFIDLIQEAGLKGFYKGFTPNVLRIGSFNMLVFVFYEEILRLLRGHSSELKIVEEQ